MTPLILLYEVLLLLSWKEIYYPFEYEIHLGTHSSGYIVFYSLPAAATHCFWSD